MRKICAALLLSLICAVGLAGKAYPKPPRNQTPKKKPTYLYQVSTRDETTGESRFGFIDNTGRLVIGFDRLPKETFGVGEFHDGRALIITKNKTSSADYSFRTGYIDETGAVVIPATFYIGLSFSEGLAHVVGDGFRGYIDRSGQIAIKVNDDDESGDFHEGLAAVGAKKHWGYIDRSGRTVIKREYEFAGDFSEGLAAVVVDQKLGFIDKRGEMKIPPRFEPRRGRHGEIFGTSFSEGLAPVSTEIIDRYQGTYGYINKKGDFVIKPQFQTAQAFSEGLAFALVKEGLTTVKKVGWIDKSGTWVLTAVKDCISDLVKIDSEGYMDWRYREGLIYFCDYSERERLWGYMDRTGRVVIEPQRFNLAGPFIGGIARVFNGVKSASPNYAYSGDYGYIDRTGKFIWHSSQSKATGR